LKAIYRGENRLERTSQVARENLLEGERHNLYLLPSIEPVMKIKSMRVGCADLMTRMRVDNT